MAASFTDQSLDSLSLNFHSEMKFRLDCLTTATSYSITVFPSDAPIYLLFHHFSTSKIFVYDLATEKMLSTIRFQSEGPDGIGNNIRSMYFNNFDSIFLFAPLEQRLLLVDSSGRIKKKYDLLKNNAYVLLSTTYPGYLRKNFLYMSSYAPPGRKANSDDYCVLKFNLLTSEIEGEINYSKQYDKGYWGKHNYHRVHFLLNEKTGRIIVSYPNDHYIYSQSNGILEKHYAGTKKIKTLNPIAKNYVDNDALTFEKEMNQGLYKGIFYDRWNDIYYRIAYYPANDIDFKSQRYGPCALILLDNKLRKVGEYSLPKETYVLGYSFIIPDGIALFNKKKYENDQDYLWFDLFRITKKND